MISFCFEFDNFFHLFKVFMSTEVIVVLVYVNVFLQGKFDFRLILIKLWLILNFQCPLALEDQQNWEPT